MPEPIKKFETTQLTVAGLIEVLGRFDQSLPVLVQSWEGEPIELDVMTEIEQINVEKSKEGSRADYRWPFRPKGETIPALIIR